MIASIKCRIVTLELKLKQNTEFDLIVTSSLRYLCNKSQVCTSTAKEFTVMTLFYLFKYILKVLSNKFILCYADKHIFIRTNSKEKYYAISLQRIVSQGPWEKLFSVHSAKSRLHGLLVKISLFGVN